MKYKAGQIVYGPFPIKTSDRRKINHYCLVVSAEESMINVAIGTSSHIDSCPKEHEFQVESAKELNHLRLKKATRFDLTKREWVKPDGFHIHATVVGNDALMRRLFKAARSAGLI